MDVAAKGLTFSAARLRRISELEDWHFWFVGRLALVDGLLRRHLPAGTHRVLDGGCGTGFTLERLVGRGLRGVGLDLRREGIARRLNPRGGGTAAQGRVTALPFRDRAFDAGLLLDVLEHVDDRRALDELVRVVRPGGTILVTVPAMPWLWSFRDEDAGHLRRYTRRSVLDVLRGAGLDVLETRYYQFLLFPLVVLARILGRRRRSLRDREEEPPRSLNGILGRINRIEARLGERIPWPWGSSLAVVCRTGRDGQLVGRTGRDGPSVGRTGRDGPLVSRRG